MRKEKTAEWKARSSRNRHNGRVNYDSKMLMINKNTERFKDARGVSYFALPERFRVVDPINPKEFIEGLKSRIIKVPPIENM